MKKTSLLIFTIIVLAVGIALLTKPTNPKNPSPNQPPAVSVPQNGAITIQGRVVCLPHKDTNGPQTTECAYGLKDDTGRYFGLIDTDPTYKNISGIATDARVEVEGAFAERDSSKYQDIGVISVIKVTLLTDTTPLPKTDSNSTVPPHSTPYTKDRTCPKGYVDYGMPLQCVTTQYMDFCTTHTCPK